MKNTTKKLLIALTALFLVGVLVLCVACNDPYAGNYKEVSEEDREAFVEGAIERIEKLAEDGALETVKMTYTISMEQEYQGEKGTSEIEMTIIVDGSKFMVELEMSGKGGGESHKASAKVWMDMEKFDIYYQGTIDGKKTEGKYTGDETDPMLMSIVYQVEEAYELLEDAVDMIEGFLMEEEATIYADGDNFKITAEEDGREVEVYFIFEADGAFRCKVATTVSSEYEGMKSEAEYVVEIVTSSEKVTIPTNIK